MSDFQFDAKPTVGAGGNVTWELCFNNPPGKSTAECGDGSAARPYPNVTVPKGVKDQILKFTIKDNPAINFAPNSTPTKYWPGPIWAHKKGNGMGPGVNAQLEVTSGAGGQVLVVKDKNDNSGELTLHYQLNFLGPGNTLSVIDPDITNGGKPSFTSAELIAAAVGAALIVSLIVTLIVAPWAARRAVRAMPGANPVMTEEKSGPGDINRNL